MINEIVFYFSISLVYMSMDALVCSAIKKPYRHWISMACCLAWPLFAPLAIFGAIEKNKEL